VDVRAHFCIIVNNLYSLVQSISSASSAINPTLFDTVIPTAIVSPTK